MLASEDWMLRLPVAMDGAVHGDTPMGESVLLQLLHLPQRACCPVGCLRAVSGSLHVALLLGSSPALDRAAGMLRHLVGSLESAVFSRCPGAF